LAVREQATDVGIGHSFPQEMQHLDLPRGEGTARGPFGEAALEGGADDALARVRGEDGGGEFSGARGLATQPQAPASSAWTISSSASDKLSMSTRAQRISRGASSLCAGRERSLSHRMKTPMKNPRLLQL
jgi:hypothetical protein